MGKAVTWHYKGECYERMSAEKLGSGCIDATRLGGSGYFTCIPISSQDYRKENKTRAGIEIEQLGEVASITITDDYGARHLVNMDGRDSEWIQEFMLSAKNHGLLN